MGAFFIFLHIKGVFNLPNPKPGHTTGGSGRGGAWPSRKGRRRFGSPRRHLSLVPTRVPKTTVLKFIRKHEQSNSYLKPTEEQNHRLTTGLSAVHPRFISGTRHAPCSWLLTSVPTPICLCKPFSCKACPGTSSVGRPDSLCFYICSPGCKFMFLYCLRAGSLL